MTGRPLPNDPPSALAIHVTAFVTGLLILTLEIAGPRLLQAYYGVGLYVWSGTISVTLLALAIGYALGGRVVDDFRSGRWPGLALMGAGATVILVAFVRTPLLLALRGVDMRLGILLSTLAFLFVPLLLLGMVAPVLVAAYAKRTGRVGRAVGRVFFLSTLGSVVGALLTGFFLIEWLRTSQLIFVVGATAILLGVLWWVRYRGRRGALSVFMVLAALLISGSQLAASWGRPALRPDQRILHVEEGFYGEIKVAEATLGRMEGAPRLRVLFVDGRAQAMVDPDDQRSYQSFTYDLQLVRMLRPAGRRVLLVGLGSGLLASLLAADGLSADVVEIDPRMLDVARTYFGFDDTTVRVLIDDGRHYLETTSETYDFILFNAFQADRLPVHLYAKEMLQTAKTVLAPGGILVSNFYGYLEGPKTIGTRSYRRTLESVFAHTRVFSRYRGKPIGEMFFFASDLPLVLDDGALVSRTYGEFLDEHLRDLVSRFEIRISAEGAPILTDDYNPLDLWLRDASVKWFEGEIENWGAGLLLH